MAAIKLEYCIQCRDRATGHIGSFAHKGDFVAVSPIFPSLVNLYAWMDKRKETL